MFESLDVISSVSPFQMLLAARLLRSSRPSLSPSSLAAQRSPLLAAVPPRTFRVMSSSEEQAARRAAADE